MNVDRETTVMPSQPAAYLIHCIVGKEGAASIPLSAAGLEEIVYKDIAAAVRKVDAANMARLLSHDEGLLKDWLAAYQQVNIDVFRHRIMLPLRFGTMVDRKEEVEAFLSFNYIHIKWALDRLMGKAEFAVQVSWDLNAVLREVSQDKRWLDKAKEPMDPADKIEIGRLLFEAAHTKKKEIVESIHRKLSKVSIDSSEGKCADEPIIMSRSYLIERAAEGPFDEAMAELAKENESYLSLKYVGPIPPYSFAPLEFKRGNFELIDEARRTLLLPECARFKEIKASYRRLSLRHHPDKNPDDQRSSERFRRIDEAYKILEMYCYSCEGFLSSRENSKYSFAKGDVEKVFLVKRKWANGHER